MGTTITPYPGVRASGERDTPSNVAERTHGQRPIRVHPNRLQLRPGHAAGLTCISYRLRLAGDMAQPHKGARIAVLTRIAPELGDAVRLGAHERGVSMSDFVASLLADALQLPDLAPLALSRAGRGPAATTDLKGAPLERTT